MINDQFFIVCFWYYMEVFVDLVNVDVVYVLNVFMMWFIDGGKIFSRISVGYGDIYDLWINLDDNMNMILGDDGGVEVMYNIGVSWLL